MIPTRTTADMLLGTWQLVQLSGRTLSRLLWDNERVGSGPHRAEGVPTFIDTLASRLVLPRPRDPESRGLVERRNGGFGTSLMPGRSFRLATRTQRSVRRLAGEC